MCVVVTQLESMFSAINYLLHLYQSERSVAYSLMAAGLYAALVKKISRRFRPEATTSELYFSLPTARSSWSTIEVINTHIP